MAGEGRGFAVCTEGREHACVCACAHAYICKHPGPHMYTLVSVCMECLCGACTGHCGHGPGPGCSGDTMYTPTRSNSVVNLETMMHLESLTGWILEKVDIYEEHLLPNSIWGHLGTVVRGQHHYPYFADVISPLTADKNTLINV